MAHHLSNIADLTGDTVVRNESFEAIDEAIKVFTQVQ